MIISLGVDPGTANYAYGIVQYHLKGEYLVPKILSAGQLHWTISNLTDSPQRPPKSKRRKKIPIKDQMIPNFSTQLAMFEKDWRSQIKKFQPTTWAVERFQSRGLRGKTVEAICIMNGVLAAMSRRNSILFNMITAAQWKNRVNAYGSLEEIYSQVTLPPHIVDACFISTYQALKYYNLDWDKQIVVRMSKALSVLEYKR